MPHTRLNLVVAQHSSELTTDHLTEAHAPRTTPDSSLRHLGLVGADEGAPPEGAA
jgi:hypothetical protein